MYDIELEKDTSTVESGLTWLITCFLQQHLQQYFYIHQSIFKYHVFRYTRYCG